MSAFRARIHTTALLLGLAFSAACESPVETGGGGQTPDPQPQQPASLESVQVAPDTFSVLAVGGHRMVNATVRGRDGAVLQGRWTSWTSSDLEVATVDASGNVTGHQPGLAWITATVEGRTGQARVTVLPLTVDSLALSEQRIEVAWETERPLGATAYAADGRLLHDRAVAWSSSDEAVATVDALGNVRAVAGGRAWITATSEGRTARAEVVVPEVKEMEMRMADDGALPRIVRDVTTDEGEGRRRRVRTEVVAGTMALNSITRTYMQRVTVRTYERMGTCVQWHSCIWDAAETVREQPWTDAGRIERNEFTGEPIFASERVEGLRYYAQNAQAGGYTVWQGVPGTGGVVGYRYTLK